MDLLEIFEKEQIKNKPLQINPGDKIKVYQKIQEGGKTRTQSFEGIVIRKRVMKTARANFTVRKIVSGIGVEKTFFIHSPNITKIKITKKGKTRRAKLYYIRERRGRAAKMREKEGELSEWEIATTEPAKQPTETPKEKIEEKPEVKEKSQKPFSTKTSEGRVEKEGSKEKKKEEIKDEKKESKQKETKTSSSADITSKDKKKRKEKS